MTELRVYATSDLHAHWAGDGRGIARVLTRLARRDAATSILVDNGDLLTGSDFGAYLADQPEGAARFDGPHPILAELERAGFDVWVPGNHDFDHGVGWLRSAVAGLTSLTVLCANCVTAQGEQVFQSSRVVQRAGLKVGIIGAVTGHVQRLGRYGAVQDVRFTDPVAAVEREVARLRPECDLIIVAYHGGFVVDPATGNPMHYNTGEDQASSILAIAGVDGVIAGHQHWKRAGIVPETSDASGPVAYVQPGYAGAVIGEMIFAPTSHPAATATQARLIDVSEEPPAEGPLDALHDAVAPWLATLSPHDDDAIHSVVAARMGGATALALPAMPRSLADLAASFPGVYGVSRARLPETEYRAALAAATEAGLTVSERGVTVSGHDVEVVVNAPLRAYLPEGRVQEDSVVDWLDEIVYAQCRGTLAEATHKL